MAQRTVYANLELLDPVEDTSLPQKDVFNL